MPNISFFADKQDLQLLLKQLNTDSEIAFIVSDGPLDPQEAYLDRLRASGTGLIYIPVDNGYRQRWKAIRKVADLQDGSHSLWHVPAGPLPLLTEDGPDQIISDPWTGWTEQRPGADSTKPYFGADHPAEIVLELWTRHQPYSEAEKASLPMLNSYWENDQDLLVVSDFQWINDHCQTAPQPTWHWWNRLEAWVAKSAARIGHFTDQDEDTGEEESWGFWAFPSALQKLRVGMAYSARGWELDSGIRAASGPSPNH